MRLAILGVSFLLGFSPALAADKKPVQLEEATLDAVAADKAPNNPVFFDSRARGGCDASEYQYVFFNLSNPENASAGRWNSLAVAEILAVDGKPAIPLDEIANWTIDAAQQTDKGLRITLTELIPPNGSRGDTQTITLILDKTGHLTIPEWQRKYIRCKAPEGEY